MQQNGHWPERPIPLAPVPMISSAVGMSEQIVAHYCRFQDKRDTGKAALVMLAEPRGEEERRGNRLGVQISNLDRLPITLDRKLV
jgi:hypothetical protein